MSEKEWTDDEWRSAKSDTWGTSSRCPECGYKQGDMGPEHQPLRLTRALSGLSPSGVAEAREAMRITAKALRSGPVHTDYRGWCAHLADGLDSALSALEGGE
jgi:hypothetical protein